MIIDEKWIAYKIENSQSAKDELIVHYVELVKIIAGRLYNNYNSKVEYDDLLGYGIIGLIDAIEKFDIEKRIKFETYANIRIRGAIIDQLRVLDWIPRSTRQKYKMIEEALSKLQNIHGQHVTDKLLAQELNLDEKEVGHLLSEVCTYSVASLDEKISEYANFALVSQDESTQPEMVLDKKEMEKQLVKVIDQLSDKEKKVIQLYYYSEMTYKEIAKILGVSESRVSQIHSKAIMRLKISLEK